MTLNYAHRGYSSKFPEDTMLAFDQAVRTPGCDGISIDVQMSKDGVPVIIHDVTLNRTCTNMTGKIRAYNLDQLKKAEVSAEYEGQYVPQYVPTLREYLEFIRPLGKKTMLELKTETYEYEGLEQKVVDLLKEFDLIDRTIVASCNHYSVRRVKELCPELKCGLLSHSWIVDGEKYVKDYVGVDCYMPNFGQCTAEMVKRYHEAGVEVYTWTANEEVDIEHLINVGVDGIITDFPEQVTRYRRFAEIEDDYPMSMAVCGWAD